MFDASKKELNSSKTNKILKRRRRQFISDARGYIVQEELEGSASVGDNIVCKKEKRGEQRLKMERSQKKRKTTKEKV